MTWARLDDAWTDRPVLESLTYEARWHYLALVVFCSRTSRYDGQVRAADARRCSDVPDAAGALDELLAAGLVVLAEGGYQLPQIGEHVPPPHLRDEERKAAQRVRKQRSRAHAAGDHSTCLDDCPSRTVTGDVTRDIGTGRDGTGRDQGTGPMQDAWPVVAPIPGAAHDLPDDLAELPVEELPAWAEEYELQQAAT